MTRKVLFIALLAFLSFGLNAQTVTAHRGGAFLGNENTLSCIEKGIASGADLVEIDIHKTKDGAIVVCHDETLDRTTDTKGRIEEMTLEEIRRARIVDQEGNPTEEAVPTLEEVLQLIDGRCSLLLEIKLKKDDQYPGIVPDALALVNAAGMHDLTIVQSFNDAVIEEAHALDPTLRVEKLLVCRLPFGLCFDVRLHRFSFDRYGYAASINPCYRLTSKRFIRQAHKAGKEVRLWTVNAPLKRLREADGVITNDPTIWTKKDTKDD